MPAKVLVLFQNCNYYSAYYTLRITVMYTSTEMLTCICHTAISAKQQNLKVVNYDNGCDGK